MKYLLPILSLVLIVLKLIGAITCPWWFTLAPLIVYVAILLLFVLTMVLIVAISD